MTVLDVPLPMSNSTDFDIGKAKDVKLAIVISPPPAVPPCVCVQRVSKRFAYDELSIVKSPRIMSLPKVARQPARYVWLVFVVSIPPKKELPCPISVSFPVFLNWVGAVRLVVRCIAPSSLTSNAPAPTSRCLSCKPLIKISPV